MKVLFFAGKGGVGKSTLAAAASWQISERWKVHLVSLDPAHNLSDIFRLSVSPRGLWIRDRLLVEEVDVQERAKTYLNKGISLMAETYAYLKVLDLDKYFSLLQFSPGMEEYALLLALEEIIHRSDGFDYVIFDTPPTGLTLRFLALPRITLTWIEKLILLRRKILEKRDTIQVLSGEKKKGEFIPDPVMDRLMELKERYEKLISLLGSDTCGVVVVFNPDTLSVKEAGRLLAALKVIGLKVTLCIQNKVRPSDGQIALDTEREMRRWTGGETIYLRVKWEEKMFNHAGHEPYLLEEDLSSVLTAWGAQR